MKRLFTSKGLYPLLLAALTTGFNANAQQTTPPTAPPADSMGSAFKPGGTLWGYTFGDFSYKGNADNLNRGGSNQYTGQPQQTSQFQFRRIYLGYNYNISKHFTAELLLAAEDDFNSSLGPTGTGDVLSDGKLSPYVKLANIRWKNIWKNTDLVVGNVYTPAFPLLAESVWGYRSIERTVSDIRRTPSFDLGATLQGHFDDKANYGYDLMVGNGNSAKPESDNFKWLYGDVYAKFLDKKLIIDVYQDYEKLNWSGVVNGQAETATTSGTTTTYALPASPSGLHHDRRMTKVFIAYTVPKFTVGVEAFYNTLMGDVQAVGNDHKVYYLTTKSYAISAYVRGRIYKDKLGFFARYDHYDPSLNIGAITDNGPAHNASLPTPNSFYYTSYKSLTSQYDPSTKENFVTAGLDFTPFSNVHIMPNIWMNNYTSALSKGDYTLNTPGGTGVKGTDMVYRLTFYFIFGKKEGIRF